MAVFLEAPLNTWTMMDAGSPANSILSSKWSVAYITVFFYFSASLFSIYGHFLSSTPSSSSLIMLVFLFAITLVISTKNRTSQYALARWFLYTGFGSVGDNQGRLVSIRSSFFSTLKERNLSTKFCQSRYFVLVKAIQPSSICCMVSWDLPLILPVTYGWWVQSCLSLVVYFCSKELLVYFLCARDGTRRCWSPGCKSHKTVAL